MSSSRGGLTGLSAGAKRGVAQDRTPLEAVSVVDAAIESRMSVRAFTNEPVSRETIKDILRVASRAPSGTNTQAWHVYVVEGAARDPLVQKVCAAHDAMRDAPDLAATTYKEEYDYYPKEWFSPYIDRRRENGWSLYSLLGIARGEKEKMHSQLQRNYKFFDAPVGLFFTIDRKLEGGALLDSGMFIQNIMVAARARDLHTCPQAAWNRYASIVLPHIGAPASEMLVCGMALGFADDAAIVNRFRTPRVPVDEFTTWVDAA